MKLADSNQSYEYMSIADTWLSTTKGRFSSGSTTARIAVAEFLANQDGLTLYFREDNCE